MPGTTLFGSSDLPIGVELHAGGVRLLQIRKSRRGLAVRGAARVSVDDRGRPADDPLLIDELAQAVAKGIDVGRFSGRRIVLGLDGRMVRTRSVRQPRVSTDEMDKAARLDAPSRLGFADCEGCEIGWFRAGEVRQGDEIRDELIYVGARREPLERLLTALSDRGLMPSAVEPAYTALARSETRTLRRASDENVSRVLVDVGEQITEVMVTRGRAVAFYKQVELGGRAMTKLACDRLGLDAATVGDLRRRRMTHVGAAAIDQKVDRALFDAVRPLINDLSQEVTLCLRYFSVTFRGSKPEMALVSGSEAGEPQLAHAIGESLHIPASVSRPLDGLDLSRVEKSIDCGGAGMSDWGACFGLSTRALEQATARKDRAWKARAAA